MWRRSGDLTGSWKAFAARWDGLLVCTRSPCRQRSVHKKVYGGVVSCQASGISEYGSEIFNYIPPVSLSRHPRCHDQSNFTTLLGARAVPTASFYRWENQVTELLHDRPTVTCKVCWQPGTGSPNIHPRSPAQDTTSCGGSASPPQACGVSEKQLPTPGPAREPPPWGPAGLRQGVPISRGRGQNLLWE